MDSEHCALHQCLRAGTGPDEVARLVLTASGGPFRGRTRAELAGVAVEEALAHPTWRMGPKITVDSSTFMNKGLEVIEAHELFGVDYDRMAVIVHPQSVVHSMVEFIDGATVAQLSQPDMRLPIGYALGYPDRLQHPFGAIDWASLSRLDFEQPDREVFACLDLAEQAGRAGGLAPAWLNAGNEVAVAAFLDGRIGWRAIAEVVADTCRRLRAGPGRRCRGRHRSRPAGPGAGRAVGAPARAGGVSQLVTGPGGAAPEPRSDHRPPCARPATRAGPRRAACRLGEARDRRGGRRAGGRRHPHDVGAHRHRGDHRHDHDARARPLRHGQVEPHEGDRVLPRLRAPPVVDPPGRDRVRRQGHPRGRLREDPRDEQHRGGRPGRRGPHLPPAPFHNRLMVAVAGSFMHFVMAFVLFWGLFVFIGAPQGNAVDISGFAPLAHGVDPARTAGLKRGRHRVRADGVAVHSPRPPEVIEHHAGAPVTLVVDRAGTQISPSWSPRRADRAGAKGHIGVLIGQPVGAQRADRHRCGQAGETFGQIVTGSFAGLGQVFSASGIKSYVHDLTNAKAATAGGKERHRPASIYGAARLAVQGAQAGAAH